MGHFNFYGGLVAAFFGAFFRDSIQFLIIKKQGKKLLEKKEKLQKKINKASGWFDKNPFLYLTLYRLMYGFSTVIILMSGLKNNISYARFAFHTAIGTGLWIIVVGGLGYFCAEIMIEQLNFISEHSLEVIGILSVIGLIYWFFFKRPYTKHCITSKESE